MLLIPSSSTETKKMLTSRFCKSVQPASVACLQHQNEHHGHLPQVLIFFGVLIVQKNKIAPFPVFFLHSISSDIKRIDSAHLGTSAKFLQPCRSVMQKGPAMYYEEFGEFTALLKTVCSAVLPQGGSVPVLSPVMLRNCSLDLFSNNPTPLVNYRMMTEIIGSRALALVNSPHLTSITLGVCLIHICRVTFVTAGSLFCSCWCWCWCWFHFSN